MIPLTSAHVLQPAPPGRLSPADQRMHRFAGRHPAVAGRQVFGVFRAQVHTFAPGRVPRRQRRLLLEAEPHRGARREGARVLAALLVALPAAAGFATVAMLKGLCYAPVYGVARLIHGRAWEGGWRSEAGRFLTRVLAGGGASRFRNTDCLLVFTADGLVVLDDPAGSEAGEPCLLAEAARGTVRLREQPPAAGPVHRLDLAFADGSWLALRLRRPGAVRDAARLLSG